MPVPDPRLVVVLAALTAITGCAPSSSSSPSPTATGSSAPGTPADSLVIVDASAAVQEKCA